MDANDQQPDEPETTAVPPVTVPSAMPLSMPPVTAPVAARKGSFQAPKSVEFIDSIPQTPVGKPDKKALRAIYAQRKAG